MAHASEADIVELQDVIVKLRGIDGLTETKPGLFQHKGRAFLHFHRFGELFCFDVRAGDGFKRVDLPVVRDATAREQIVGQVRQALEGLR